MESECPMISVVIPARNEEKYIEKSLKSILTAKSRVPNEVEIVVVINRCTDKTEEIAVKYGAKIVYDDSKNLARIRNAGVRAASGAIVVTIDADSTMSANMFEEIIKCFSRGRYIGGAVNMKLERYSLGIIATILMLAPIAFWHRISGGLFFCLKEDFDAIGGFNESLSSVEDIDFAVRLKKHGRLSHRKFKVLLKAHIITSCRKFDHFGDWYMVKHPLQFLRALKGKDQKLADKFWYDFDKR